MAPIVTGLSLTGLATNASAHHRGGDPHLIGDSVSPGEDGEGGDSDVIETDNDQDTFEVLGNEIKLSSCLEVYEPRWAPSIERWEVDYVFGSIA